MTNETQACAELTRTRLPTDPHAATLATLAKLLGEGVFSTSRFRDNLRLFVPPSAWLELLETVARRVRLRPARRAGRRPTTWAIPGRTRPRFEVHYVLRNLDTFETPGRQGGRRRPRPGAPLGRPALARGRLDGARSFRYVRHPIRRASRPAADPDARGVHRLSRSAKTIPLRGRGERHNFPRLSAGRIVTAATRKPDRWHHG